MLSGGQIKKNNTIRGIVARGLRTAGAPTAGTSEIQTLTIGGSGLGGTIKLKFMGFVTAAITWSSTNATLLSNINTALDALPNLGDGDIVATADSLTSGIGTISLTFSANEAKKAQPLITVADNSLTGTSPTLGITEATPGVDASFRGAAKGAQLVDTTNGINYVNTGTGYVPTWTKVGTQS